MLPRPVMEGCDGAEYLVVLWNDRREPNVRAGASCRAIIWWLGPRRNAAERTFPALMSDMIATLLLAVMHTVALYLLFVYPLLLLLKSKWLTCRSQGLRQKSCTRMSDWKLEDDDIPFFFFGGELQLKFNVSCLGPRSLLRELGPRCLLTR